MRIVIAWRKLTKGVESLLLGCTRQFVYKLVEQGKLPTSRLLEATGQQAYYRHVGGIVIVEELAEPLQPSSLAVVHRQQRHCQPAGQVDHAVGGTVEYEQKIRFNFTTNSKGLQLKRSFAITTYDVSSLHQPTSSLVVLYRVPL